MELLGDVGHVESCFRPFGGGTSIGARYVHGLHQLNHRVRNRFGRSRWYSEVLWVMSNLVSVHLEIVLVLVQDRCTVYANRTIGSGIILDAPDGTTR